MQEVAIRFWDDLEFSQSGSKVEATVTVTVGLDGQRVELDLSKENEALLREEMTKWLKAGRPVTEPVTPPKPKKKKSGWPPREWEHGTEYGKAIRKFAEDNGLSWHTTTGKVYYNKKLRDEYAKSIGMLED